MSKQAPQMNNKYSPDPAKGSTATLTIDLAAIGANFRQLGALGKSAECAAVVKADAYGCGVRRVAPYLQDEGCKSFFVATLGEAINLREILGEAKIYVFDGLFPGSSPGFLQHNLSPVLGSTAMLEEWSRVCNAVDRPPPAALHIDTGMNRLGVGPDELPQMIANQQKIFKNMELDLIMSHLACADEPTHPRNQKQLDYFNDSLKNLPQVRTSLANSAGIFLGAKYHFDQLRPGISLYGGRPNVSSSNPMQPVAFLTSQIAQIRWVEKGDAIGYGARYVATRRTRVATLPVGYADGYLRALGSTNEKKGASGFIGEHEAPLLGRVSMDLITIDITDIPADLVPLGAVVELLGSHVTIDDLAELSGTIGYEILTSLGNGSGARSVRRYKGDT